MPTTHTPPEATVTRYRPIRSVPVSSIRQLYEVYAACSQNPSIEHFIQELGKKTGVAMMVRRKDRRVVGFSTQTLARLDLDGRPVAALISDEHFVLPPYARQNDLAAQAGQMLLKLKARQPSMPLYWCRMGARDETGGTPPALKRAASTFGKQLRKMNPGGGPVAPMSVSAFDAQSVIQAVQAAPLRWIRQHILRNYRHDARAGTGPARVSPQQQPSWRDDSSLDEALERGETS